MTIEKRTPPAVRQLRLVVETEDYDAALRFYRDVLGLVEREVVPGEGDARITILEAGRATLELSNPAQVRMIDQVEADGQPSAKIRVAFQVEDAETATHGPGGGRRYADCRTAGNAVAIAELPAQRPRRSSDHAVPGTGPAPGARRPARHGQSLSPRGPSGRKRVRRAGAPDGGGTARSAPGSAAAAE